jgi:putative phage-type endonuclease
MNTIETIRERATFFDDRAAWLEARKGGVGGSDAPAVLGQSPWSTALEVYASKVGDVPDAKSEQKWWGQRIEGAILAAYAEETNRELSIFDGANAIVRSADYPWQACTPDALVQAPAGQYVSVADADIPLIGPGIVQVKNTRSPHFMRDWSEGEPPTHVMIQLAHEMAVTGCQWGSVAVLFFGSDFRWYDVVRGTDAMPESFIHAMTTREAEFWRLVETRTPPDLSEWNGDARAVAALYPTEAKGKSVSLGDDAQRLWDLSEQLDGEISDLESRRETCRNAIKLLIGDAEAAALPNWNDYQLTYKTQNAKGYTVGPKSFRVLRKARRK